MNFFNPSQLQLARKKRKFSIVALSQAAGITSAAFSRIENGKSDPKTETIAAIASVLNFPEEFFFKEASDMPTVESVSFRSLASMKAKERDAAISSGAIAFQFNDWIERYFEFPKVDIPKFEGCSPSESASALREHWGLGNRPVGNVIKLLEAKGVRVFSLHEANYNVDAFSCWSGETPFCFLNVLKSSEHSRFDAAHELGHLIMHRHADSLSSKSAEKEANSFAAAFLMPRRDVLANFNGSLSIKSLIKQKLRWKVSLAAFVYTLNNFGAMSEWEYRNLNIQLSQHGYRKKEPSSVPREVSALWPKVFEILWRKKITREYIAKELAVPLGDFQDLFFGLLEQESDNLNSNEKKVSLNLVINN